ncbi:hypothetical protein [Nocardia terpenica]|uniref:hypothetical protein n=1 Tax=Nocardia terpenica TaxID=455432 RepID=UPI0012E70376|nr:hypothetical protein [Nocardia terpenica]NQE88976.1 hypothetical protein [Nocardia terpenica]
MTAILRLMILPFYTLVGAMICGLITATARHLYRTHIHTLDCSFGQDRHTDLSHYQR